MRAAGSEWLLFQAAPLVGRSTSIMDSQTTLAATASSVATCMPQQRLQQYLVDNCERPSFNGFSQCFSCASSGMCSGVIDK